MADDGMLVNFDFGDDPLKPQVKFKGGRWRDRVRAQRGIKKWKEKSDAKTNAADTGHVHEKHLSVGDSQRPAKRQKTDDLAASSRSTESAVSRPSHGSQGRSSRPSKPSQVTSKLFTSNPAPTTNFDEPRPEDTEAPQPSNAPLSEEAENFLALGLSRRIAQHLSSKLAMKAPTAIQKNTIPQLVRADSDAFLQAETGSGKTLAYLLPIVHRLMDLSQSNQAGKMDVRIHRGSGLFAIILAPTRELCKQIAAVLEKVLRCAPWLVSTTVIGGESKKSEKARLRKGVNILIATPGRLTDHLDHTRVLDVGTVRWLVLDEGDRLMEMGFEDDIRTIVGKIRKETLSRENRDGVVLDGVLPSRRVTVLCSATMKMNVQKLGEISLEEATHITASSSDLEKDATGAVNETIFAAPSQLKQSCLIVPAKLRLITLISFLKSAFARRGSVMKAIIFISCADSVNFHFDLLKSTQPVGPPSPELPTDKLPSLTESTVAPAAYITSPANPTITLHKLHGSLPQPVRTSTLASFTISKNPAVLVTTDISSRGLDVPAVDLVIEYDPAFAVADHLHRIGRTARAGRPGKAVLFLLPGCEEGYVSLLKSGSSPITPQLYDEVLQKGLASMVDLPKLSSTSSGSESQAAPQPERQSYTARAEALQLHLEQRLLAPSDASTGGSTTTSTSAAKTSFKSARDSTAKDRGGRDRADNPLLISARNAFRSHVRAYATHVREERRFFDITQLHLGHAAKSFALREAPGGIGGGVSRRTHHKSPASAQGKRGAGAGGAGADGEDGVLRDGGEAGADDAARRMRAKMKEAMNAASEFNIG